MRALRKIRIFYKKFLRKTYKLRSASEVLVADVLYDRRQGVGISILSAALVPLSFIFLQIVKLRKIFYKKNIFLSQSIGCPVIVVGNLTLGGTGKTPIVEKLARELCSRGRKVAVLSRGYKSRAEPKLNVFWRWITNKKEPPPKVVSDGRSVFLGSNVAGDEPFMLASNLSNVPVVVDKDRVKAGRYAVERFGADTLVLDDGYQYFPLHGHINLLLIDKTNPFGNGYLLPRGILREPLKEIRRASYVFITKSDCCQNDGLVGIVKHYNPNAKIVQCAHFPRQLISLDRKEARTIDYVSGKKIMAFSGIASPNSFENFLIKNNADVVYKKRFADHHLFSNGELDNIFNVGSAKGAEVAITTEKDAVRIPKNFSTVLPTFFIKIDIEILDGKEVFEEILGHFN